jgi:hypothetical protein
LVKVGQVPDGREDDIYAAGENSLSILQAEVVGEEEGPGLELPGEAMGQRRDDDEWREWEEVRCALDVGDQRLD